MDIPQITYNKDGICINGNFIPCENPRLEFLKRLKEINDWGYMVDRSGSLFHSRVYYDPRTVQIGRGCVIGDYGFGFEYDDDGKLVQMPHLGGVIIDKGVQIKNNVCIDRGVIQNTIIGEGTKIDNLVHVGHSAIIGKHCLIVAGTVIGGSAEIGDRTFLGMNCSIKQKVKIGKNCIIGAGAVIIKDIPDNQIWIGNPGKYLKDNKPCAGSQE